MSKTSFSHVYLTWFIVIDLLIGMVNGEISSKFALPERFMNDQQLNIDNSFRVFTEKYKVVNLQSSQVDFLPPTFIRNNLLNVTLSNNVSVHQYSTTVGHRDLRKIIARLYSGLINQPLNPNNNIIVTMGATEALYLTFQTHTFPGDEWILFEPFYDRYPRMVRGAGSIAKYIRLRLNQTRGNISSTDWTFNKKELARLFNKNTKGILLNNPHNPTGKVFTREELQFIADLAIKWNTIILSDEVYEWLLFDSRKHIRIASLPDVYERTITVSSASKSFFVSGWRIGWAYGPADLLSNLKELRSDVSVSAATPTQMAVAASLSDILKERDAPNSYLVNCARELQFKRDYVIDLLRKIGMTPTVPEAGYFITVNWTPLNLPVRLEGERDKYADYRFTKWLAKRSGVLFMPQSFMYSEENRHYGEKYVRICFVKKNKTLHKMVDLLLTWISRKPN